MRLDFALVYPEILWALIPVAAGLDGFDFWKDEALKRFDEKEAALHEGGEIAGAVDLNVRSWVDGPGRAPGEWTLPSETE